MEIKKLALHGYTWPKMSRHLFFHEKGFQKISQYSEILFGDVILCFNRFGSNLISDCLFITIYCNENIPLENFVMSLLGHVYLRRVRVAFYLKKFRKYILVNLGENWSIFIY